MNHAFLCYTFSFRREIELSFCTINLQIKKTLNKLTLRRRMMRYDVSLPSALQYIIFWFHFSVEVIQPSCILYLCPTNCTSAVNKLLNTCPCPCSDHRPSCQRAGESCWRPRGPADSPLGEPSRAQGRPVSGEISDQIQTGGQRRMEGGLHTLAQTCRLAHTHTSSVAMAPLRQLWKYLRC